MVALTNIEADRLALRALAEVVRPLREGAPRAPSEQFWTLLMLPEGAPARWTQTDIFDIAGNLIFKDRSIKLRGGQAEWRLRVAGDTDLPSAVVSIGSGEAQDYDALISSAVEAAEGQMLHLQERPPRLICYAYPKLGVLCEDDRGAPMVFDIFEHTVVALDQNAPSHAEKPGITWTPLDARGANLKVLFREMRKRELKGLVDFEVTSFAELDQATREDNAIVEEEVLGVPLYGQRHSMACVPACFQMILSFHGMELPQEDIATALSTSTDDGTDPDVQAPAVSALTDGRWQGEFDSTAEFSDGRTEVLNGRPLKEAIAGHARVLNGYRTTNRSDSVIREVLINDPYPAGRGRTYWERWGMWTRFNNVYFRGIDIRHDGEVSCL